MSAVAWGSVRYRSGYEPAIRLFEGLYPWPNSNGQSTAIMPGVAVTSDVLRHDECLEQLIQLINRFSVDGISWTSGDNAKISLATAIAAKMFLRALPTNKMLPKIAPDGEGGLILLWEVENDPLLVTIDDFRLSAVVAAATPRARYLEKFPPFDRADIPSEILDVIPAR